jgi:hypothetical protein
LIDAFVTNQPVKIKAAARSWCTQYKNTKTRGTALKHLIDVTLQTCELPIPDLPSKTNFLIVSQKYVASSIKAYRAKV